MEELWAEIPNFDQYDISNYGSVRNRHGKYLSVGRNQAGLLYVSLFRQGRQHNRAVAPLVAGAFLEPPPHHSWDTPTHLNGNRGDAYVENLVWRPRWFAMDYHYQIHRYSDLINRVRNVETGEEETIRVICMRYAILPLQVLTQASNYTNHGNKITTVWPTRQIYELV